MTNSIIPLYKQADKTLVRSAGCCVYDTGNKKYLDFESGDWAANLGHSPPAIKQRITQQVDKLVHDGLRFRDDESEQLSVQLLEKTIRFMPPLTIEKVHIDQLVAAMDEVLSGSYETNPVRW